MYFHSRNNYFFRDLQRWHDALLSVFSHEFFPSISWFIKKQTATTAVVQTRTRFNLLPFNNLPRDQVLPGQQRKTGAWKTPSGHISGGLSTSTSGVTWSICSRTEYRTDVLSVPRGVGVGTFGRGGGVNLIFSNAVQCTTGVEAPRCTP